MNIEWAMAALRQVSSDPVYAAEMIDSFSSPQHSFIIPDVDEYSISSKALCHVK